MTPSSLPPARSPSVPTQEPTLPAPGHLGMAMANTLQPPHGMPGPWRTAQPGPSAPGPWHVAVPLATTTVFVPVPVPVIVPVFYPVWYEIVLTADQASTLAKAEELANHYDFGLQLALAGDNYAVLHQCVEDVNRAAGQFRLQWAETGSRECRAAAQALTIEGGLLNGLYAIRRIHKDWLSQESVVSPASLMYVLPLFRHALHLCRTQSDAVQFPITGLKPALERLHKQVIASLQSLQAGQWQATGDGRKYAQSRGLIRTGNADSSRNPFTRLEGACQELQHVLEQLLPLVRGPVSLQAEAAVAPQERPSAAVPDTQAPAQASGPPQLAAPHAARPLSFTSVLTTGVPASGNAGTGLRRPPPSARPVATKPDPAAGRASGPTTDKRVPRRPAAQPGPAPLRTATAARELAATVPPSIRTRSSHHATAVRSASTSATSPTPSTPLASPTRPPPALPQADDRVPSSPTGTLATPLPVDPVAEAAAQLRQERVDALQAALAPLQAEAERLSDVAQAAASDAVTRQRWDRPRQEFAAWQAVVRAYDACTADLATQAAALFDLGSGDPEVRRLQRDIDKASGQALACAGEAASGTLAAFAQACHKAIVEGDLKGAGFDSYTQLAEHCRDLHDEWAQAPLRPRMQGLEDLMGQYGTYEKACRAKDDNPAGKVPVLDQAELLYEAAAALSRCTFAGASSALEDRLRALHRDCKSARSKILKNAVTDEIKAVHGIHVEQGEELAQALWRSANIVAACDTLLTGDPLQQALKPGSEHEPPSNEAGHDALLIVGANEAIKAAEAQHDQSIKLPTHDVAPRRFLEQQAGWVVLRRVELMAETAAKTLECFHDLSEALGTTPPKDRPALIQGHAETLEEHASDLRESLRDHQTIAAEVLAPKVRDPLLPELLDIGQTRLHTDLRTTKRMQAALAALEELLKARESAQELLSRIEPCSLADLAGHESSYTTIAKDLGTDMTSVQETLPKEEGEFKSEAWEAERKLHDQITSALQDRITCEKVLVQGKLLRAWVARAGQPGSGHLDRPEDLLALKTQVGTLIEDLTKKIKPALMQRAASSEYGDKYRAQLTVNQEVWRDLLHLLVGLHKRAPAANAVAGGSR